MSARSNDAPFGRNAQGVAYKQEPSRWVKFLASPSNKGLSMSEKREKYYGLSPEELKSRPIKARKSSICVRKSQSNCSSPCTWKNQATRKNGIQVRAHCRMPLRTGSPNGPRRSPPKPASGCRLLDYEDCTVPCKWTNPTLYKNKKTGNTVNRKGFCAFRSTGMTRPTSAEDVANMRTKQGLSLNQRQEALYGEVVSHDIRGMKTIY